MRTTIYAIATALCVAGGAAQAQGYNGYGNNGYGNYPGVLAPQFGIFDQSSRQVPQAREIPFYVPPSPRVPDPSSNARSPYPWGVQR